MTATPLRFWWLGASALLVCVGSLGPWAKVFIFTAGGLDADGMVTLVAGLAALAVFGAYLRSTSRPRPGWPLGVAGLAGLLAASTGVYDWTRLHAAFDVPATTADALDLGPVVSVGWGLVLVTVAGLSLLGAAYGVWAGRDREPARLTIDHVSPTTPISLERRRGPARVALEPDDLRGHDPAA